MAPSRDRLLHFGFKATVSDRGRELGGQKDVGASSGRRGSDQIRAGDPRLKAQVPRGSLRASEPSQCWRGSGDVPVPVLLFSPVRGHARTRTRPTAHTPCPPPHARARTEAGAHLGTSLLLLVLVGWRPVTPRSRRSRAHRPGLRRVGEGWARAAAAERSSPPPTFRGPGGSAQ